MNLKLPYIFLLNGEVIWQASDSPLSKELHAWSILFPRKRNFYIFVLFANYACLKNNKDIHFCGSSWLENIKRHLWRSRRGSKNEKRNFEFCRHSHSRFRQHLRLRKWSGTNTINPFLLEPIPSSIKDRRLVHLTYELYLYICPIT